MYAPSAVNKQPWHFIVFEKNATKKAIMKIHQNAAMLKEANKGILVCYDEHLQHDQGYGPVDSAAAVQNMLLASHDLGLGACWIGLYPREERMNHLKQIFGLPSHIMPFAIIALGYPAENRPTPDRIKPERIRREHC